MQRWHLCIVWYPTAGWKMNGIEMKMNCGSAVCQRKRYANGLLNSNQWLGKKQAGIAKSIDVLQKKNFENPIRIPETIGIVNVLTENVGMG